MCFGADARTGAPLLCTLRGGSGIAVRLSVGAGRMQIATRLVFTFVFARDNCRWGAGLLRGSGGGWGVSRMEVGRCVLLLARKRVCTGVSLVISLLTSVGQLLAAEVR